MKIHQHNAGHITKMAVMPYMVKHFKLFCTGNKRLILMKLCTKHQRPKPFIFCSNYDPALTVTYFMTRSNFATLACIWENVETMASLEILHPVTWSLVNIVN